MEKKQKERGEKRRQEREKEREGKRREKKKKLKKKKRGGEKKGKPHNNRNRSILLPMRDNSPANKAPWEEYVGIPWCNHITRKKKIDFFLFDQTDCFFQHHLHRKAITHESSYYHASLSSPPQTSLTARKGPRSTSRRMNPNPRGVSSTNSAPQARPSTFDFTVTAKRPSRPEPLPAHGDAAPWKPTGTHAHTTVS